MWLQWALAAIIGAVIVVRVIANLYDRPSRPSGGSDTGAGVRE